MLAKTHPHSFRRRNISVTSLIDVIFLLLLFFMLTSTFSKYAEVELLSAGAGNTNLKPDSRAPPLFLRLSQESLSLNGDDKELENLSDALENRKPTNQKPLLLVSLSDDVTSQRLVDLLAVLGRIKGINVQGLGG